MKYASLEYGMPPSIDYPGDMDQYAKEYEFYNTLSKSVVKIVHNNDNLEGLKLGIIAGVHGDEPGSMIVANKIIDRLLAYDDNKLDFISSILILPYANINGLKLNKRDYIPEPENGNDINRKWGNTSSDITTIRNNIKYIILESDIILDLHCSPNLNPIILLNEDQYKLPTILKWCNEYDINCGVRTCNNNTIKSYASSLNKIAMTVELNGMQGSNINNKDLENYTDIIDNIILCTQYLFDEEYNDLDYSDYYKLKPIISPCSGIFVSNQNIEDIQSSEIGYIYKINKERVPITINGMCQLITPMRYVNENNIIGFYNKNQEDLKNEL